MLAKGMAREPLHKMILKRVVEADLAASSFNFYVWIPSESNVADKPSRFDAGVSALGNAKRVEPNLVHAAALSLRELTAQAEAG
eukprot:6480653-Amphidinium_carterae.1